MTQELQEQAIAQLAKRGVKIEDIAEGTRTFLTDKYHDELEYFCVKTALCSSMSRIGRVSDKQLENRFLDTTFSFIREQFPEYKRNKYFTGKIGMYIKLVNRGNAKIIDKILARKMKG